MKQTLCLVFLVVSSLGNRFKSYNKAHLYQHSHLPSWEQNQLTISDDLIKRIDQDLSAKNHSYEQALQINQLKEDIDQIFDQSKEQNQTQKVKTDSKSQMDNIIQDQTDISLQLNKMFNKSKLETQSNNNSRFKKVVDKNKNSFEDLNEQNQALVKQIDQMIRFEKKNDKKKKHLKKKQKKQKKQKKSKSKKEKKSKQKKNNKHERILDEIKSNLQIPGRKILPFGIKH